MKEETDNPIDRIRWGEEKEDTKNGFHILNFDKEEIELIEIFQKEFDNTIFPQWVLDSHLYKFYEIKYRRK